VRTAVPTELPVIVECVTLWLSNLFERESQTPARKQQELLMAAVRDLAQASRIREVIVVSNEVGGGIVPTTRVGRRFRDLQGWANQILAAEAASVTLVIAGLPLVLKGKTA
jgi:adenosylcobinamide kinase/adenosylcobinamide-phosphate guanylyltransferase